MMKNIRRRQIMKEIENIHKSVRFANRITASRIGKNITESEKTEIFEGFQKQLDNLFKELDEIEAA